MKTVFPGDERESRPVFVFCLGEDFLLLISAGRAAALTNRGQH